MPSTPSVLDAFTFVIEPRNDVTSDQIFEAAEVYLPTKIGPETNRAQISKNPKEANVTVTLVASQKIVDSFEGMCLQWELVVEKQNCYPDKIYFELTFDREEKEKVMNSYLPFLIQEADRIKQKRRIMKLHTLLGCGIYPKAWQSVHMEHPFSFDNLAMDSDQKQDIIDDLNRFVGRKDYYRRVGKPWKRGYLLYGPPGTGKSSLIAAIANHLKFDIYDLQLKNVFQDSDWRRLMLFTPNRSILVIEDIDCNGDLTNRKSTKHSRVTLSGLLNFIDGLWSSCGDEKIIIFTTNFVDGRLDPALLRPGRMDKHIHMSYLTMEGFKILASNYLGLDQSDHPCFEEIERLIQRVNVTAAEVAEELLKSNDADHPLQEIVAFLNKKDRERSSES